jgi:hypothetical protein
MSILSDPRRRRLAARRKTDHKKDQKQAQTSKPQNALWKVIELIKYDNKTKQEHNH